jgi:hypothetical protein
VLRALVVVVVVVVVESLQLINIQYRSLAHSFTPPSATLLVAWCWLLALLSSFVVCSVCRDGDSGSEADSAATAVFSCASVGTCANVQPGLVHYKPFRAF